MRLPLSTRSATGLWDLVKILQFSRTYMQARLYATKAEGRQYKYYVNADGALFLADVPHKNFVARYRDEDFLDFFFTRVRKVRRADNAPEGYPFVSPCGVERNFIQCETTPIVYQDLIGGNLTWAGTQSCPFKPNSLYLHEETGYLYHPSPLSPSSMRRNRDPNPYGHLSMLRSDLVQRHFSQNMQIDDEGTTSIAFGGNRYVAKIISEERLKQMDSGDPHSSQHP